MTSHRFSPYPTKEVFSHDQEGMADDSCLVDFEEIPDTSYDPRQGLPSLPLTDDHITSGGNFSFLQDTRGNSSEQERVVPELIIAVFVVQFDTRRGKPMIVLISFHGLQWILYTVKHKGLYFQNGQSFSCFT